MTTSSIDLDSPLGTVRLFAEDDLLSAIWLPGPGVPPPAGDAGPRLGEAAAQLADYFAGRRFTFSIPLHQRGTPFQRTVWAALAQIPYGETCSYGELARAIGRPAASRAVGAANGRNPLAIVVPCHRVIAADGTLHGYAGGLPVKRWLLDHEARHRREMNAS